MATGNYDENGIWIYGEDDIDVNASDMLNRLALSVSDAINAQRGRLVYTGSNAGNSNGWYWTNVLTVTFPRPFASGVIPVVDAHAVSGDQLNNVTIISVTNAGFTCRVMRLVAAPTNGTLHWKAERQTQ